jgi:5'-phosphate synthase pdxT subunit
MQIGVLALQGAFAEHRAALARLGVAVREVRRPEQLSGLAGLILPGGESTTMRQLLDHIGLGGPLVDFAQTHPVWGTCAGAILLAHDLGEQPPHLDLMDLAIQRNAFGRQLESFEADLAVPALCALGPSEGARPFRGLFIRAPRITAVGPGVGVLARLADGTIAAAQQGHLLATTFHPELAGDDRFHRYFLELVRSKSAL